MMVVSGVTTTAATPTHADSDPAERSRLVRSLFEEHYDSIWRLLRRFGVPVAQADDATQQVFLVLAERISDVRAGSERAFLYGTALRIATSLRRISRREVPTADADESSSSLPRADDLIDQKRARDALDRLLDQMTAELRSVFILYELEGFTTPEIAEMVEIPLGTAASRLRRAREQFKELVATIAALGKRGGTK